MIRQVVLFETRPTGDGTRYDASTIADELAARIGGRNVEHREAEDSVSFGDLAPGRLCIAATKSWEALAASDPPQGAAVVMVLDPPPRPSANEDRAAEAIRHARV